MAFDHLKVAEKLRKSGTGHDTLKLILEEKNGDSRTYEDAAGLIRHLEQHGKIVTADKVRVMHNGKKEHGRKDVKGVNTDELFDRHQATEAAKT